MPDAYVNVSRSSPLAATADGEHPDPCSRGICDDEAPGLSWRRTDTPFFMNSRENVEEAIAFELALEGWGCRIVDNLELARFQLLVKDRYFPISRFYRLSHLVEREDRNPAHEDW